MKSWFWHLLPVSQPPPNPTVPGLQYIICVLRAGGKGVDRREKGAHALLFIPSRNRILIFPQITISPSIGRSVEGSLSLAAKGVFVKLF